MKGASYMVFRKMLYKMDGMLERTENLEKDGNSSSI